MCSKACGCQACSFVSRAELGDQISCRAGVAAPLIVCTSRDRSDPYSLVGAGCDVTATAWAGIVSGNGDGEAKPTRARQRCQGSAESLEHPQVAERIILCTALLVLQNYNRHKMSARNKSAAVKRSREVISGEKEPILLKSIVAATGQDNQSAAAPENRVTVTASILMNQGISTISTRAARRAGAIVEGGESVRLLLEIAEGCDTAPGTAQKEIELSVFAEEADFIGLCGSDYIKLMDAARERPPGPAMLSRAVAIEGSKESEPLLLKMNAMAAMVQPQIVLSVNKGMSGEAVKMMLR